MGHATKMFTNYIYYDSIHLGVIIANTIIHFGGKSQLY